MTVEFQGQGAVDSKSEGLNITIRVDTAGGTECYTLPSYQFKALRDYLKILSKMNAQGARVVAAAPGKR